MDQVRSPQPRVTARGLSCTTTGLVPGDDDHGVAALVVRPGHDLANRLARADRLQSSQVWRKASPVPTEQSCVELHMSGVKNEQFEQDG
jgi:hypothetical protein